MGTPDTVCESLSVPCRDKVFMKEVIKKVWGIGEGLVADLGGVFVFLILQNQPPWWPKLGWCSWRSGRADVSWGQKCWGSTLAPEGNAVGSGASSRAPCAELAASDVPGKVCIYLKIHE